MPDALDHRISSAEPDAGSHTVRLTWENGDQTIADFAGLVGKGVFEAFADPKFFAQVRVGRNGRTLEWPDDIDFCADALWFEAHPEDNPFTNAVRAAE